MDGGSARTVGAVADLTGLSVRPLHHYDHIGLVVPGVRTPAGYRGYTDADVERLHLVLVYRSVGLPLDEIRDLLGDGEGEVGARLHRRRRRTAAPGAGVPLRRVATRRDPRPARRRGRRCGRAPATPACVAL